MANRTPYSGDDATWKVTSQAIRNRVIEYLGGEDLDSVTCTFLATCDGKDPRKIHRHSIKCLDTLLSEGTSLARSLDDESSTLIHLDIEYVNFDDPASAFVDPWRAFAMQQPVVETIEELLVGWGIRPLHLVTGQGHHFVWSVGRESESFSKLTRLAFPNQPDPTHGRHEMAFQGLSLVMECFASEIRNLAQPNSEIPIEITALHVGKVATGRREMISIDISEYGDPLSSRMIRIPFTSYCKPWASGLINDRNLEDQIGHFVTLPLHEMDVNQALKCRQDVDDIKRLAKCSSVTIPQQEKGTNRLIDFYLSSPLRDAHGLYYQNKSSRDISDDHELIESLPACVGHPLIFPNDLLLKPALLQLVTRCLRARQWEGRDIAKYIESKFEDPVFQWGTTWEEYSPAMRADFYVRLFYCLIETGRDPLIDFNCTSQQEKGFCWPRGTECSLQPIYDSLVNK